MSSTAAILLGFLLAHGAPGGSVYSLAPAPGCGTDPSAPSCGLERACGAPGPLCGAPRWSPVRGAWVVVENRAQAEARWRGIAESADRVARRLVDCKSDDGSVDLDCEPVSWPRGPGRARELALRREGPGLDLLDVRGVRHGFPVLERRPGERGLRGEEAADTRGLARRGQEGLNPSAPFVPGPDRAHVPGMRMLVVVLVVVACSSSETDPSSQDDAGAESSTGGTSSGGGGGGGAGGQGGQATCTPGQETACYGDGLCLGSHVCGPDGTAYGPCTCADASSSGGAGGTAGTAAGGSGGIDGGQDAELDADAGLDADAAACPEPCSASVNFPWLVKSGQPNAQGYAKAMAACPPGSVFDANSTGLSSLYCWGCGLATPTKTTSGAYQCSSNKYAPLGSCEIHFRCNASNWCTPLAAPCS